MIEQRPNASDQLNTYNVAQLQFALADPKTDEVDLSVFLQDNISSPSASPALIPDLDYDSRRMSSSATSAAETDSSAISRGEKRPASPPADSPQAKKSRSSLSVDQSSSSWDVDSSQSTQPPTSDQSVESKLQLPSILTTFSDSYRPDLRRASLPNLSDKSASRIRHAPYPPTGVRVNYPSNNQSSLSTYQFPPASDDDSVLDSANDKNSARSRLTTDTNFNIPNSFAEQSPYSGAPPLTNGTTPSTSTFSSSGFGSPVSPEYNPRAQSLSLFTDNPSWHTSSPSGIVRPSSTGQLPSPTVKYEDNLRHSSFSAPMSQSQLFAGSARISGQHDRKALSNAGIKNEWSFPNSDLYLPSTPTYSSPSSIPHSATTPVANSPNRHPQAVPSSTLVERPQRKRGKLPKETTDFLKSWLHKHSDHPYPSEEEKKQLCHATGLSMSQVSNWMINARRRILAPAHRAASGPTTTTPFPPSSRIVTSTGLLEPNGRRASMPADTLQLYHPMSLQSLPNSHHHHAASEYSGSNRHMLGFPPARTPHRLSGPGGSIDFGPSNRLLYPHSAGPAPSGHYLPSSNSALSAPPSAHSFSHQQQNMYSGYISSPRMNSQQQHEQSQPTFFTNGQLQPGQTTQGSSAYPPTPQ